MTRELNLEPIREDYRVYVGQRGADSIAVRQATVRLADAVPALLARVAELEAGLRKIATGCENYTSGVDCESAGRTPEAKYLKYRWCDACIARLALEGTP